MTNPKICACGRRARCRDARAAVNGWRRRYRCPECGASFTTLEVKVDDRKPPRLPRDSESIATARALDECLARVRGLEIERDRYLRALVHIRSNTESILTAHEALARIAGEFQKTPEFINARWNYTEANAALTGAGD